MKATASTRLRICEPCCLHEIGSMNPQDQPHAASLDTNTYADLLDALSTVISSFQMLHQKAIEALEPTVQDLVRSGSRDMHQITMTGMAGHNPGISGHVRPESLVTLLRNTHMTKKIFSVGQKPAPRTGLVQ